MARTTLTGKQIGDDSIVLGTDTSGVLPVTEGGTNATTAAGARTNLGLAIGADVQGYNANLTTWAGKTAPTGTVVGTTDTQTLTNKTLTSPVINSPTGFLTGAAKITVASSAPSSPSTGDVWIDTT